jgi:hypothetical protein
MDETQYAYNQFLPYRPIVNHMKLLRQILLCSHRFLKS